MFWRLVAMWHFLELGYSFRRSVYRANRLYLEYKGSGLTASDAFYDDNDRRMVQFVKQFR